MRSRAAMPYEPGPKIISRDDQGDPVYEDVGLTPRFVELTRKFKKALDVRPGKALLTLRGERRRYSAMSTDSAHWPASVGGAPP